MNSFIKKFILISILLSGTFFLLTDFSTITKSKSLSDNVNIYSQNKFLVEHEAIIILSDDDMISYNFPGNGTKEDPYIIENYNITTTYNKAITVSTTTLSIIIRNCYLSGHSYGIYISNARYDTVEIMNNTCNNNLVNGINIHYTSRTVVKNNTCTKNTKGMYFIYGNEAIVSNNNCSGNSDYGLQFLHCDAGLITSNILQNNGGYGLYLAHGVNYHVVHHNRFVDNNKGGESQGYDNGEGNIWYDVLSSEGNYWSDWSGINYYNIDGSAGKTDKYPLDEDGISPTVTTETSTTSEVTIYFMLDFIVIILVVLRRMIRNQRLFLK
jgi:parallel beta-helix repeat protein